MAAVFVGVVAIAAIAGTATAGWLVQRSFPQTTGEVDVAGLDAEVTVTRDDLGIPTVVATTSHDLFYAQGYVHAQDRFWEMDVRRHITAGRLSEMFGETQVETDQFVRTLGWRRIAEQELDLLTPETLEALQAYADGVNAYLADRSPTQVSLEYALLGLTAGGYEIEPWTPADSVSWLKAMAWDLRSNLVDETTRALLAPVVGARLGELYPSYPFESNEPIVRRGGVVDGEFSPTAPVGGGRSPQSGVQPASPLLPQLLDGALAGADHLDRWLGAYGPGIGSNSFAVTGDRSASGGALLANDPHLSPSLPGIWYQMNLRCDVADADCPYDVGGFTFSGVPGVIIGHNQNVAWGFTNNGSDVTDLAYEAIRGDRYVRDGALEPLDVRQETIDVAGGEPVDVTIRSTPWGPLLSDVDDQAADMTRGAFDVTTLPGQADEVAVALRWTALQPTRTADAILQIDLADDFGEFRDAAKAFEVPSQNMLYADVDGHIGYQMPGTIPIRPEGNDGTMPVAGWNSANAWTGYIPFDELPWEFDPPEQYIVTANQAVIEDYPHVLAKDWAYGYRSQRLADLIESSPPLTPESAARLMFDNRNGFAPVLIDELFDLDEALLSGDAELSQPTLRARAMLEDWDYQQDADSPAAAYYNAVWRNVLRLTFEDELTGDLRPDGGDRWFEVMAGLFTNPRGDWWDDVRTDEVELRDQVLARAMNQATTELSDQLGDDPQQWRWGDLHQLELRSPTFGESGVAPLEKLFNRGPFETSGGEGIVNATGWTPHEGYGVTWVPSMRMVVDLADLDASRWVHLTGQSGHVFSPHYTDQLAAWASGDTYAWQFSPDAVAAAAVDTLELSPR